MQTAYCAQALKKLIALESAMWNVLWISKSTLQVHKYTTKCVIYLRNFLNYVKVYDDGIIKRDEVVLSLANKC